jgi:hypothetical protein
MNKSTVVRVFGNVGLCVISVIFAVLLMEGILRSIGFGEEFKRVVGYGQLPRNYHVADPVNGFDIAENILGAEFHVRDYVQLFGTSFTVFSNELGCRDRSLYQKGEYVLLLGDSFSWGYVPLEHTFGAVLEQQIGRRVLKCGVAGYGTRQEQRKLERIAQRVGPPRAIVVAYFVGNDVIDDYLYPSMTVVDGYLVAAARLRDMRTGGRERLTAGELRELINQRLRPVSRETPKGLVPQMKDMLTEHSHLYTVLKNNSALRRLAFSGGMADPPPDPYRGVLEVFHSQDDYLWLREAWVEHLENLRQFKRSAERLGTKVLFVMIPTVRQVYDFLRPSGRAFEWESPNLRLSEFFKKEGILYLDLLPELKRYANLHPKSILDPKNDLYWHYDRHLNLKGNRLAGLLIGRFMLEQQVLQFEDKTVMLADTAEKLGEYDRNDL